MAKRNRYTPEYRREAAALVLDTDRPIAHVAEEIGVGAQLLGRWVQQERERRDPLPGPDTPLTGQEREELKQLRRRVHDLAGKPNSCRQRLCGPPRPQPVRPRCSSNIRSMAANKMSTAAIRASARIGTSAVSRLTSSLEWASQLTTG